ncbi:ADP-D-ribose binding [Desmophyllum pertusum]|uniref:ADP-D-ribose binding n=1 Tax=Desmophyllum pertusum TaxID=174260 RepID=A0A9W9Z485_9CNID|nr:ADP-D-ribose binding [Desmophyllum pertusum]
MDVDPPHSSRVVRSKDLLETYIGKVKVSVYKGDLTREQVDVIVNAANDRLRHDGGVAQAILDRGGKVIEKESNRIIQQRGPLKGGEAVYTKAGKLPCKMVVHAVGPEFLKSRNRTKIENDLHSIAAIGSGIYAMPKDACAEVMFDAVEEFVRQGDSKEKSITDVRFVNIDDSAVQVFRKEFISRYENNQEHPKSNKLAGGESVKFPRTGAEGGSSMTPRSDRGKNRKKNGSGNTRATTNPSNVGAGHHHDAAFGSSAANNDHPLRDSSHPSSSTTTYSGAVKNTPDSNDARPSRVQEPGGAEGSNTGFHLPSGRKEAATDRKDEGKKDNASKRSIILIAISGGEHMSLKQGFPATTLTTLKGNCMYTSRTSSPFFLSLSS